MLLKFLNRKRDFFLKIYSFLPLYLQVNIKIFYRKYILNSVYKNLQNNLLNTQARKEKKSSIYRANMNYKPGVNLIGFPSQEFGLGQHLKYVAMAFSAANIPCNFFDCSYLFMSDYSEKISQEKLIYNTNIFVCNGDAIAKLYMDLGEEFFSNRYNIHYGAWELRKYPNEWIPTLSLVDEYWAMSSFLQKSVSDIATIPVVHMPYPIDFKQPNKYSRKHFNLPDDKFLFIFTFDMSSVMERKNPKAVIESFFKAFPKEEGVGLVIKIMSRKDVISQEIELKNLITKIKLDKKIFIIDETLARDKMLDLIGVCDAYVSLHRAEGFGIGMAEAMKMQKPVIATDYSGNTDFTLRDNSCLVNYKLIPLKPLEYIYEEGKVWADPSVDEAAFYMKKLFEDQKYRKDLAQKAKEFIDENFNSNFIKEKYISRLKILGIFE